MLSQQKLAQKRHSKKLKRKNKKYSGPKYGKVEQLFMWAPLLEKAGISITQLPQGVRTDLTDGGKFDTIEVEGSESATAFKI